MASVTRAYFFGLVRRAFDEMVVNLVVGKDTGAFHPAFEVHPDFMIARFAD